MDIFKCLTKSNFESNQNWTTETFKNLLPFCFTTFERVSVLLAEISTKRFLRKNLCSLFQVFERQNESKYLKNPVRMVWSLRLWSIHSIVFLLYCFYFTYFQTTKCNKIFQIEFLAFAVSQMVNAEASRIRVANEYVL